MTFDQSVLWFARRYRFVREVGGPNRGLWVQLFQTFAGGALGDSWCAHFVCYVLAVLCEGYTKMPIPRSGSCAVIYAHAKAQGWLVTTPVPGDLYLYLDSEGHAHHIGFVTEASPLVGIAGNTSEDGTSSNGDRVAEHALRIAAPGRIAFVHYPRPTLTESL